MTIDAYRRPWVFFGLATLISWALWFGAAYVSHQTGAARVQLASSLGLMGLVAPVLIALGLMLPDPTLRSDLLKRIFNPAPVKRVYWILAIGLMPSSIVLAQLISLTLGYRIDQFVITGHATFSSGVFPVWFLLILAPILEELAWHSYGNDSLRRRFDLFTTCLIFGTFWAIWHAPLALIKDYYQSHLITDGRLNALNFPVSILPFVVIMNWLYYKTGRNIWIAAVFHITAGFFNELFSTHPDSKVIQTGLLLIFATVIVVRERSFFFDRTAQPYDTNG